MRLRFMSSIRRLRLPIACSLFALAVFSGPVPDSSALSCPKIIERTFYSDATKTVEVGYCITRCNRTQTCSGTPTAYFTTMSEPCGCS